MSAEFEIAPGRFVGKRSPCLIIAEIGQNHQGDINIAKQMIKISKEQGADCVKFQKSWLIEKFNKKALARPYTGPNSWGKTYGEHKNYLEFSLTQYKELQEYANEVGIIFTASAMDEVSIDDLNSLNVPFIKIGSGDSNNLPLIEYAASKNKPLVVSTGMIVIDFVRKIYNLLKNKKAQFCLLHCISSYPTPVDQLNLNVLDSYLKEFPDIPIGYSGHELGNIISLAAVAKGAKIIERHITLDKTWRGSDHSCSLTPDEFGGLIRDIRTIESSLGSPTKRIQPCEYPCMNKLGKTLVAKSFLSKGTCIEKCMLTAKVAEPRGIPAQYLEQLVGKVLLNNIQQDESIVPSDIQGKFNME